MPFQAGSRPLFKDKTLKTHGGRAATLNPMGFFIAKKMEIENKLGCVYFVKLNGLAPIKIGYSTNPTPQGRLESFAVGAPYGVELVCFFQSEDAKRHETLLHKRFASFRINGEWFEISKEQARSACEMFMMQKQRDVLSIAYEKLSRQFSQENEIVGDYPLDFSKWIDSEFEMDVRIDKSVMRSNYLLYSGGNGDSLSQKKFTLWVKDWCNNNGLNCIEGKSHVRWIMITRK